MSFKESRISNDWKKAIIIPNYKGGDKEEQLNYRAMSLKSAVAKFCESNKSDGSKT